MPAPPEQDSVDPEPARPRARASSPYVWVSTTYFGEGFPYTIVNSVAEVLFKELGASLQAIGLTSLFHLPWNLKFLWGPFLDSHGTKRGWLVGLEVVLSALLVIMAFVMRTDHVLALASVVFMSMAIIAATHDVAIDGYYLEGLDETGQSKFVGFRAGAYRAAMFAGASPLFILVGKWGWQAGWAAAAGTMIVLTVYHARFLPRVERPGRPVLELARAALRLRVLLIGLGVTVVVVLGRRFDLPSRTSIALDPVLESAGLAEIGVEGWIGLLLLAALLVMLMALPALKRRIEASPSDYARAFVHFLEQRQIGRVLAFVILFRVGESFLLKMRYAFLEQEAAITVAQWGWINLNAIAGSIAATIVGGWLIARYGLRRLAWPFVLAQNVLNLLYMGLALAPEAVRTDFWVVQGVVVTENVGAGLGTAVFMVYIMRCCDPRHKAAHMAIVTALMSLGFTVAGVASGFLASAVGFATYFGISFVAAIPAMVLLPFVPHLDGRES